MEIVNIPLLTDFFYKRCHQKYNFRSIALPFLYR